MNTRVKSLKFIFLIQIQKHRLNHFENLKFKIFKSVISNSKDPKNMY